MLILADVCIVERDQDAFGRRRYLFSDNPFQIGDRNNTGAGPLRVRNWSSNVSLYSV